jgi:Protein of unknown function (DUF3352)
MLDTVLTMQAMRSLALVLFATLSLVAAGCGSSSTAGGITTGPSPAAQLKPGALVYLETVSDPGSDQWQQAEELLRRFPDGDRWIAQLRRMIADEGVDWEQDVAPALGETTAVAIYPPRHDVVALTNPEDPDRTIALVKKLDAQEADSTATRVVGDWVAISSTEAAIDDALKSASGDSLADDASFTSAMSTAPDDALSRLYADPAGALELFASANPEAASALRTLGADRLDFAAAWLKAKDDGAELAFSVGSDGAARLFTTGEPYSSALLQRVPADALAFVSFQGSGATRQLEELNGNPLYAMGLRRFEREVGVKLEDLVSLADGEIAFYARMALPFPELTLLLESDTPAQARASAEKLLRAFAQQEGGEVTEDGAVTTAHVDSFEVNLGTTTGAAVFSTSTNVFARSVADSLGDSERFKDALATAGVPDAYTSLAYVDLSEALGLLQVFALFNTGSERLPREVARNLEALKTLVAWGELDRDVATGRAFLEID